MPSLLVLEPIWNQIRPPFLFPPLQEQGLGFKGTEEYADLTYMRPFPVQNLKGIFWACYATWILNMGLYRQTLPAVSL